MSGPARELAFRFAAGVVADPAHAVGLWRSVTGCKAVGCVPPMPVPEILHAAGLLPVSLAVRKIPGSLWSCVDAWVVAPGDPRLREPATGEWRFEFPTVPPVHLAAALDLLESLSEWAGQLFGRPVTEGGLWKSIRAYRERDELLFLLRSFDSGGGGFPATEERRDLARAGDFLPPEAHSVLLARGLRLSYPAIPGSFDGEREDPLLRLARRLIAQKVDETPLPTPELWIDPE